MENVINLNQNAINENTQIVSEAFKNFKARYNLQKKVKVSATKNVLPLNSVENGCQHLLNRVEDIRENVQSNEEFENTNLISFKDGVYTTSLYLGKAVIRLNDEQLIGEFDNSEDAISMIEDYVALVKSGEQDFVESMRKAIAKIATYKRTDRSVKGHS